MALVTPDRDTAAPVAGLAARVTHRGDGTDLTVRSASGHLTTVGLPGAPDERAAQHAGAGYRRLAWQQIDIDGDAVHCRLRGIRHRLPSESRVSLSAALALAARGLPTIVRIRGAA